MKKVFLYGGLLVGLAFLAYQFLPSAAHKNAATQDATDLKSVPADESSSANTASEFRHDAKAGSALPRSGVASVLAKHANLTSGFEAALAELGPANASLASALSSASAICVDLPGERELDDLSSGVMSSPEDLSKIKLLEKLLALCEGFDGQKFVGRIEPHKEGSTSLVMAKQGREAALDHAREAVARAEDTTTIYGAGRVLILEDEMPIASIFGSNFEMDKRELLLNWNAAVQLTTCSSQLGCGPESLLTMKHCFNTGCAPGVSYEQSLKSSMSGSDFAATIAFRDWIVQQRR